MKSDVSQMTEWIGGLDREKLSIELAVPTWIRKRLR